MVFNATSNNLWVMVVSFTSPVGAGFKLINSVMIGTDCIGSCKSNYYTNTTAPPSNCNLAENVTNIKI
jgi:hypothetical protein